MYHCIVVTCLLVVLFGLFLTLCFIFIFFFFFLLHVFFFFFFFFFFQAEDGIRDKLVTGVQTCALPIYRDVEHQVARCLVLELGGRDPLLGQQVDDLVGGDLRLLVRHDLLGAGGDRKSVV